MIPTAESKYNRMNNSKLYQAPVFAPMKSQEQIDREQEAQDAIRDYENNDNSNIMPNPGSQVYYKNYKINIASVNGVWVGDVEELNAPIQGKNFDDVLSQGKKIIDDFLYVPPTDPAEDDVIIEEEESQEEQENGQVLAYVGIGVIAISALIYFFILDGEPNGY